jgi:plasmid stabilization system protein ParE
MPRSWSDKRERQYEQIKDSYEDRGVKADEAEERAARTVNKERAEHGETKSTRKRRTEAFAPITSASGHQPPCGAETRSLRVSATCFR